MHNSVTTRFLGPDEYPRWAELVASSPDGSAYSLPEYVDALCTATHAEFRVLVGEHDGRIVGGITLYERRSRAGVFIAQRPLLYYNGIVLMPHDARHPSQRDEWCLHVMSALERALSQLPHARVKFKSRATLHDLRAFEPPAWSIIPTWTYQVDISDLAQAWDRIDKDQRRLIRRCSELGARLTEDDDFDSFYRLYATTHERKGAPLCLPRESFRRFVETLRKRGLGRIYHARMPDGSVLASQLVLTGPHPVTHVVCAGSDAATQKLGASPFLRWKVFEDLHAAGYRGNDLTDAAVNPVTRFKSQLGGELRLCLQVQRRDHWSMRVQEFVKTLRWRVAAHLVSGNGRGGGNQVTH